LSILLALFCCFAHETALGEMPSDDRVSQLIDDLTSASLNKRRKAAEELAAKMEYADRILPHLEKLLANEQEDVVAERAAASIAGYGKRGELILLKFAAKNDAKLRSIAIDAIAEYSTTADAKTVKAIIHQLNDPDPRVRKAVLNLISRCRYEDAVGDVLKMMRADTDEGVRLAAIVRVSDIEAKAKTIAPILIDVLRDGDVKWTGRNKSEYKEAVASSLGFLGHEAMSFVVAALKDPKCAKQVKLALMNALGRNIHIDTSPDGLAELGACLNDRDPEIRTRALEVLRRFGESEIKAFKGTVEELVRTSSSRAELDSALRTLANMDPDSAILHNEIGALLKSMEPTLRETAIRIIETGRSPAVERYVKELPAFLKDGNEKVRLAAVAALRSRLTTRDSEALSLLKRTADGDPSDKVQAAALDAYQYVTKEHKKKRQ
jgi:HEAT repeat protein